MANVEPQEFEDYARSCARLAEQSYLTPDQREFLRLMAQAFMKIALEQRRSPLGAGQLGEIDRGPSKVPDAPTSGRQKCPAT